ncbi:helix-turn-helix domain-containing protein [Micromonospora humida]|uniref:helix-turn-helix domain-containing protein n=1 Tax=Micromonospora humida TaxID=2809018 RepID=UPI001E43A5FD|nr:helix-turn-helix domain-containing protein [Micromonospora humida]
MRPPRRTRTATPATGEASRREERQAWTAERIRALGPSTDLATAAAVLGMSRSAAYKLARRDAFPTPLYRVGAHYRAPTAPILAMLHLPHPTGPGPDVGNADSVGDPP